jgi:hypothetical protein
MWHLPGRVAAHIWRISTSASWILRRIIRQPRPIGCGRSAKLALLARGDLGQHINS